jgi:hypothetical protein
MERSRICPSVPQPRRICQHAPRWPIPHGIATTRGVLATTRGMLTTTRGVLTEREHTAANAPLAARRRDLPSQAPPYAPFTAAARIHSRRPPPPASTRLPLGGSLGTAPHGTAPLGASLAVSPLNTALGARHGAWRVQSRPSLAVGSRLAVESNQYLATIEIVAAERLARSGRIL